MISLFSRDDYAALGLATVLDIERIPYRRIARIEEHDQPLLVAVGGELPACDADLLAGRRAVVLNGGPLCAARMFGGRATVDEAAVTLPLSEAVWPAGMFGRGAELGVTALRLPRAPLCRVVERRHGELVAWLLADADQTSLPAVLRLGDCLWSAIDLGTAFADLLSERERPGSGRRPVLAPPAWARRVGEGLYYAAPARLRDAVQRSSYRRLERRLQGLGARASAYPIDAAGWLLIELVRALLVRAAGGLVRIARWPAGKTAAAVLTHDLEPRRYAYTDGVQRLLARVAERPQRSAYGVVATAGARYLAGASRTAVAQAEVYCHGLTHRGEPVWGRRRLVRRLRRARARLERHLGRPVRGYRSPRLERSPDLDWALDAAGFTYDSSRPDVDRENLTHYGGGVRLNLPYRPLLEDGASWRASRCLELPLTAPDCIQPLFGGQDVAMLRAAVAHKAAFVRASGGLYVALVHAGVFGPDDASRREAHLGFVAAQLTHRDTWFTGVDAVVEWWQAREALHVALDGADIRIVNQGCRPLAGAVLVVDRPAGGRDVTLPVLQPGARVTIPLEAPPWAPSHRIHAA